MGRFVSGINGPVVGKVGNIIGSSWRGIPYIKSRGLRTKPPTEGEKLNRFIFKKTQSWLQPINDFVRVGFNGYSLKSQGIHAAKSYLHKNALIKNGYDTIIDPSLMKVSFGTLPLSKDMQVEFNDKRELVFTWNPVIDKGTDWRDQVMLMAYNVDDEDAEMVIAGQFRGVGSDKFEFIDTDSGVYHIYAAFVSSDRERQSDSIYLGEIVVEKANPTEPEESKGKNLPITEKIVEADKALDKNELGKGTGVSEGVAEEGNSLNISELDKGKEVSQGIVEKNNGLKANEEGLREVAVSRKESLNDNSDGVKVNDLHERQQLLGIDENKSDEKLSPLKRTFISIFSRRSTGRNKRFRR